MFVAPNRYGTVDVSVAVWLRSLVHLFNFPLSASMRLTSSCSCACFMSTSRSKFNPFPAKECELLTWPLYVLLTWPLWVLLTWSLCVYYWRNPFVYYWSNPFLCFWCGPFVCYDVAPLWTADAGGLFVSYYWSDPFACARFVCYWGDPFVCCWGDTKLCVFISIYLKLDFIRTFSLFGSDSNKTLVSRVLSDYSDGNDNTISIADNNNWYSSSNTTSTLMIIFKKVVGRSNNNNYSNDNKKSAAEWIMHELCCVIQDSATELFHCVCFGCQHLLLYHTTK